MRNKSTTIPIILTVIIILGVCCVAICLILLFGGSLFLSSQSDSISSVITEIPQRVTEPIQPSLSPTIEDITTPTATSEPTPPPSGDSAGETLFTLEQEIVPINDPIDLGERLGGKNNIPETLPDPNAPYQVGDTQDFWVTNVDTNNNFRVTTTLRYLGDNVYIWIENGVEYDASDLRALGDAFDNDIYPTNQEFFGKEWSPGVDGDPRIYIVYAGGLGYSLAGYYSSADELHPDAHEYSNAHEMFLINSDNVYLWEEYIYGTLAHEHQHMIHWYTDKNEETWLNEGFSMLAELINDLDPGGFDTQYVWNPDLQLTDWGTEVGQNGPHYGAAFLFTSYFLDRFGEDATKALVAHDKNGMESIDLVMEELGIRDPLTGQIITADDIFRDWAVTNLLGDQTVSDRRYHYGIYPDAPLTFPGESFPICPMGPAESDVYQFGVDYVEIYCSGDFTLTFEGNTTTSILPVDAYSGDYFFWSNMGDTSNMSLEKTFDLSNTDAPIEMSYQTWYDLEEDYDYVFVSASTDGNNWQILDTTSCTTENPSGNSYGCGLNGQSDGWQEERVDLSAYAGKEITLRFDYVTDAAVNGIGMVIDDIRIDAIDYFTDLESDEGGWTAEGFVRIQNTLPQEFIISMITYGNETSVSTITLDENNTATIDISIGGDVDSVVLVISGSTPYTRQKAEYQINIQ
jgi:hypothetical protein